MTRPTALVAISGDDVYEDLFTASRKRVWDDPEARGLLARCIGWVRRDRPPARPDTDAGTDADADAEAAR